MSLKILSWNARSIQGKLIELKHHLNSNFYHVILIQETWLNPNISLNIKDFTCLRKDRISQSRYPHGGVLIFVHSSVPFKRINFVNTDFSDSVFIRVLSGSHDLVIGSIYSSPLLKCAERKSDYGKLLSRPGSFVLGGDFNAKHIAWNNEKNNSSGQSLLKICNDNLCDINFTDNPTTIPPRGKPSFLDLVISKNVFGISKPITLNELSSDHFPVFFEIPFNVPIHQSLKVFNYAKAKWKDFKGKISSDINSFTTLQSFSLDSSTAIDSSIVTFNKFIQDAAKNSIPLKKPYEFRYKFSQKVHELIKDRNFVRRHISRYPILKAEFNRLNREIKLEIKILNSKNWNEKLSSLKVNDNSLYSFTRSIKRKKVLIPPLKDLSSDETFYDSKEKSEILAKSFLKAHNINPAPTIHSQIILNSIEKIQNETVSFPELEKTRLNEVKSFIKILKIKKAPGYDEMSSVIIKNLPDVAIDLLVNIFNSCFRLGYFPTFWKVGKIFPIGKPGKDHSIAGNYRPITLLPIIGKIFEKIILSRMIDYEESKNILRNQQFGFRSRHSTTQQIIRIMETISLRFNEDKSTAMTLLDIEKAFDSVWHDALRHKLLSLDFPIYLVKMISSFLFDRVSFVSINNINSSRFNIPAGVPQGSPLSPFLFNIFINDIPVPKHCKIAVYADDTALLSSIKNYNLAELVDRMEKGLVEIESHFASWKIKLNSSKTESIIFTQSTIMRREQNSKQISFNGNSLAWLPAVKYLGVLLDSKLLMKTNIENNVVKARKAVGILYSLLKKNSSLSFKSKLTLYRSYIRPILTYACPCFANTAKTHIQKLQVAQNKYLRMVLNSKYRTRIQILHKKTKIPSIQKFINKLTESFYHQSAKSSNLLVKRLGVYDTRTPFPRLKHKLPRTR